MRETVREIDWQTDVVVGGATGAYHLITLSIMQTVTYSNKLSLTSLSQNVTVVLPEGKGRAFSIQMMEQFHLACQTTVTRIIPIFLFICEPRFKSQTCMPWLYTMPALHGLISHSIFSFHRSFRVVVDPKSTYHSAPKSHALIYLALAQTYTLTIVDLFVCPGVSVNHIYWGYNKSVFENDFITRQHAKSSVH